MLVKLTDEGLSDTTFGPDGVVVADFGADTSGNAVTSSSDGHIFAVGDRTSPCPDPAAACEQNADVAIARVTETPQQ